MHCICRCQTHGDTAVTTDDWDNNILGQRKIANDFCDESRGTDNIKCGDTKKAIEIL
jgi:hypothetical protein